MTYKLKSASSAKIGKKFKVKNKIPLNPSSVPDVSIDTLIWNLPDYLTAQEDSLINFALTNQIFLFLWSYSKFQKLY